MPLTYPLPCSSCTSFLGFPGIFLQRSLLSILLSSGWWKEEGHNHILPMMHALSCYDIITQVANCMQIRAEILQLGALYGLYALIPSFQFVTSKLNLWVGSLQVRN